MNFKMILKFKVFSDVFYERNAIITSALQQGLLQGRY